MAIPAAPALSLPVAAGVGIALAPEYSWAASSGATSYNIQVSDKADFSNLLASAPLAVRKYFFYPVLPAATRIYWRVNAQNSDGTSAWSSGYFDTDSPDFGFRLIADHVAHGKTLVLHQFQENFG